MDPYSESRLNGANGAVFRDDISTQTDQSQHQQQHQHQGHVPEGLRIIAKREFGSEVEEQELSPQALTALEDPEFQAALKELLENENGTAHSLSKTITNWFKETFRKKQIKWRGISEVSTGRRCDACKEHISELTWQQCKICKVVDLHGDCYYKYKLIKLNDAVVGAKFKQRYGVLRWIPGFRWFATWQGWFSEYRTVSIMDRQSIPQQTCRGTNPKRRHSKEDFQELTYNKMSDKELQSLHDKEYAEKICKDGIRDERDLYIMLDHKMKETFSRTNSVPSPKQSSSNSTNVDLCYELLKYLRNSTNGKFRVLSLDGGGVRGYLTLRIIRELLLDCDADHPDGKPKKNGPAPTTSKQWDAHAEWHPYPVGHLDELSNDTTDGEKERFNEILNIRWINFAKKFDYVAGTSTGGLIAFCLSAGVPFDVIWDLYSNPKRIFPWSIRKYLGLLTSNFSPSELYKHIDATIADHVAQDYILQSPITVGNRIFRMSDLNNYHVRLYNEKKVKLPSLIVTTYNCKLNSFEVVDSSDQRKYAHYPVADMLKSTSAAPTYFPPFYSADPHVKSTYVDGGMGANNPEMVALAAARYDRRNIFAPGRTAFADKRVEGPLNSLAAKTTCVLSIGTGVYDQPVASSSVGVGALRAPREDAPYDDFQAVPGRMYSSGVIGWLIKPVSGLLVNTAIEAGRDATNQVAHELATFTSIKRFRMNFRISQNMDLADTKFPEELDKVWFTPSQRDGIDAEKDTAMRQWTDVKSLKRYYKESLEETN